MRCPECSTEMLRKESADFLGPWFCPCLHSLTHGSVSGMPVRPQETDSAAKRTEGIDSGVVSADLRHLQLRPNEIVMHSTPEEPESVKVARAIGWTNVQYAGDLVWGTPPAGASGRRTDYFVTGIAFAAQIMAANGLSAEKDSERPDYTVWRRPTRAEPIYVDARGPNFEGAVCAWIVAAAAAGVEVRRG